MSIALQRNELAPLVARVLGKAAVEVVEWHCDPMSGVAGSNAAGGKGVFRVAGSSQDDEGIYPWSMVLKIAGDAGERASHDPAARFYWRREADAYNSGLLNDLPGGHLVAPRCWAVEERTGHEAWIWLEDVQSSSDHWSIERYAQCARHLGQFNGAYLAGHPMPSAQPWMTHGRTRAWASDARDDLPKIHELTATPYAQRWFGDDGVARLLHLWSIHEQLLDAFERLPLCFAHLDAHFRNLMERRRPDGTVETVAIDWAYIGFGRIGEEAGNLLANGLELMNVAVSQLQAFDENIFSGYLAGLHDAGWRGDTRLVRLGYMITATLSTVFGTFIYLEALQDPEVLPLFEPYFGYPLDVIIEQWRVTLAFFLDLGDEALALAHQIA